MVPEIWSGMDRAFCHLGHFSPSAPLKTYKIKTLIEWKKKDLEISSEFFCHFGHVFALYAPPPLFPIPNPPQQQPGKSKLWKTEYRPRDIIILHICTINDNHIMYIPQIWSASDNIFCYFGPFFALLHLLTIWKIKILKKHKNTWILSFYTSVPKIIIIC